MNLDSRGITIVELLVVMVVGTIMVGVVTAFGIDYWTNTATLESDQETLVTRLDSGDALRELFNSTSGLITQNYLPDPHVLNADTSIAGGQYWIPLNAVPSTVSVGASGTFTPLVYASRPAINTSKNFIMNGNIAYEDNLVLYFNGSTKQLLARTIANSAAPSNRAVTTCPPALASSSCPADRTIADDVQSITTRYFSRSGNTIDYTSITDPSTGEYIGPDFPAAEVVEFKLKLFRKGQLSKSVDSLNDTIIRVALRN